MNRALGYITGMVINTPGDLYFAIGKDGQIRVDITMNGKTYTLAPGEASFGILRKALLQRKLNINKAYLNGSFTELSSDGKTATTREYNDFIREHFSTYYQTTADGRVQALNAYTVFSVGP